MSNDIYHFIEKLALIEGRITPTSVKKGLNPQQKSVPQLPALFKMKNQSTVLGGKIKPHPAEKYMVGDDVQIDVAQTPLEETIKNVEEDVLSKVKKDLTSYLDMLADQQKADKELVAKAKEEIEDDDPLDEDPTEDEPSGTEPVAPLVINPTLPEQASVKTITFEDGTSCDIYGDQNQGFEIRSNGRSLPTKFKNIDHAMMAADMYRARRAQRGNSHNQDYVDEA